MPDDATGIRTMLMRLERHQEEREAFQRALAHVCRDPHYGGTTITEREADLMQLAIRAYAAPHLFKEAPDA